MTLTPPQKACLRLITLLAAPKRTMKINGLINQRDGTNDRYISHLRVLESHGFVTFIDSLRIEINNL